MLKKGYILRSGGADGADTAFELGCNKANGLKEIYLPWPGFNNNLSVLYLTDNCKGSQEEQIARKYHPKWPYLSPTIKRIMIRNVYQVLGVTLNHPSKFILCYTKDGKVIGGTGFALRLAKENNIPILNFGSMSKENIEIKIKELVNI